jgi:hypothetical protein
MWREEVLNPDLSARTAEKVNAQHNGRPIGSDARDEE